MENIPGFSNLINIPTLRLWQNIRLWKYFKNNLTKIRFWCLAVARTKIWLKWGCFRNKPELVVCIYIAVSYRWNMFYVGVARASSSVASWPLQYMVQGCLQFRAALNWYFMSLACFQNMLTGIQGNLEHWTSIYMFTCFPIEGVFIYGHGLQVTSWNKLHKIFTKRFRIIQILKISNC